MNLNSIAMLGALLALLPMTSFGQVKLITEEEARAPAQNMASTRAITRGPGIKLISPNEVPAKSFPFKLVFEPRGGATINLSTFKIEYLKQPLVDLTERVRAGLKGNALEMSQVSVPAGQHPMRISIRDSEGREGTTVIEINAK